MKRVAPLAPEVEVDLDVEGIIERIGGLNRRFKRGMEAVVAEHGLSLEEWHSLSRLRLDEQGRTSPGELASELDISSGAMTSRLDRLEEAGLIRRLRDPEDRRSVVVEITDAGREAWDRAASVAGRREAFLASALTKAEQRQLNGLLRKLMLAFEAREPSPKK